MVVQITTAFPSVPQVPSALCPGVTGPHLLYCSVSRRKCSLVLVPQLATTVCELGSIWLANGSQVLPVMGLPSRDTFVV